MLDRQSVGADRALVPTASNPQAVSTKGFDHGEGTPEPWLVVETEGPFANYDICLRKDAGAKACAVIATVFGNRAVADEIVAAHNRTRGADDVA